VVHLRFLRTVIVPVLAVAGLSVCSPEQSQQVIVPIQLIRMGLADSSVDAVSPFLLESIGSQIILSADNQTRLPALLDSRGRLVRLIGRQGPGPGELSQPARVIVVNDTIAIQDLATRQFTLFSSDGAFVRVVERDSTPLPFLSQVIAMGGDTLIVSAALQAAASIAQPFHLVRLGGEVLRSWGAGHSAPVSSSAMNDIRYLARASDTTFWAVKPDTYALQLWAFSGAMIREIRPIGGSDFIDGAPIRGQVHEVRRDPRIASLGVTPCGDPVVVIAVSREDWAPDQSNPSGAERPMRPHGEYNTYIYQRIEILDQHSGVIIARGESRDVLISGFMANGSPFGFVTDEDGRQLGVWWEQIGISLCKGASQ